MKIGEEVKEFEKEGKKFKLRYLERRDWKDLQDYINSLVDEGALIPFHEKFDKEEEKRWVEEALRRIRINRSIYLVVKHEGKVRGIIDATRRNSDARKHVAEIGIGLKKEIRKISVGTKMMEYMEEEVKRKLEGVRILITECSSKNQLMKSINEKRGFEEIGRIKRGYRTPEGELTDNVIFMKNLK